MVFHVLTTFVVNKRIYNFKNVHTVFVLSWMLLSETDFTARPYAKPRYLPAVGVCLFVSQSVCHTRVLYRNGLRYHKISFSASYHHHYSFVSSSAVTQFQGNSFIVGIRHMGWAKFAIFD